MFEYKKATVKETGRLGVWKSMDVRGISLSELVKNYHSVYLDLTHPLYPTPLTLALSDVDVSQYTGDIVEWLTEIGDKSLPVKQGSVHVKQHPVTYGDAWQNGFHLRPVSRHHHIDQSLPHSEKNDLLLTREGLDYESFHRHCLVTVNGFLHTTTFTDEGVFVPSGGSTGRLANNNHVGILNIGNAASFQTAFINDVYGQGYPLKDRCLVVLPSFFGDLENKTVFICIGGYLHTTDQFFKRVGVRTWEIDFRNYPLAQHYYDMWGKVDLSRIDCFLDDSSVNERQVALEQLYSDDALKGLLHLEQSFFVVIDSEDLCVEHATLEGTQLPGRYISHEQPIHPLVQQLGRLNEYWVTKESDRYVLSINDTLERYYQFETTQFDKLFSIDDAKTPYRLYDYTRAHFLKIAHQSVTIA